MPEINNDTAGERLKKWDLNFDPDRIFALNTLYRPQQKLHAAVKFAMLENIELRIKQCLSTIGVSSKDTANYLNFGRQVWSLQQKRHGQDLAIEVQIRLDVWVSRGLTQSVLEAIRSSVFDVPAPVLP
jgi:hypothetical protein